MVLKLTQRGRGYMYMKMFCHLYCIIIINNTEATVSRIAPALTNARAFVICSVSQGLFLANFLGFSIDILPSVTLGVTAHFCLATIRNPIMQSDMTIMNIRNALGQTSLIFECEIQALFKCS